MADAARKSDLAVRTASAAVMLGIAGTALYMGGAVFMFFVALVAFFSFIGIWSNYFLAFVLLTDDKLYNLPVGLTVLISTSGALSNLPANDVPIKKPEVILAAILVILPVLLIFIAAQRFVRSGMLSGAEKG